MRDAAERAVAFAADRSRDVLWQTVSVDLPDLLAALRPGPPAG